MDQPKSVTSMPAENEGGIRRRVQSRSMQPACRGTDIDGIHDANQSRGTNVMAQETGAVSDTSRIAAARNPERPAYCKNLCIYSLGILFVAYVLFRMYVGVLVMHQVPTKSDIEVYIASRGLCGVAPLTHWVVVDAGAAPAAVRLIGSDTGQRAYYAASVLQCMTHHTGDRGHRAVVDAGGVPALVRLLGSSSLATARVAAGALEALIAGSLADSVVSYIADHDAVPSLVRLIASGQHGLMRPAAVILDRMTMESPDALEQVADEFLNSIESNETILARFAAGYLARYLGLSRVVVQRVVEVFGRLLGSGGYNREELALEALEDMLEKAKGANSIGGIIYEGKLHTIELQALFGYMVFDADGVPQLLRLLRSGGIMTRNRAARLIDCIAKVRKESTELAIVDAGAVPALLRFLTEPKTNAYFHAASALSSMIEGPVSSQAVHEAMVEVMRKLESNESKVTDDALLTLCELGLTEKLSLYRMVVDVGGVPALLQALHSSPESHKVAETLVAVVDVSEAVATQIAIGLSRRLPADNAVKGMSTVLKILSQKRWTSGADGTLTQAIVNAGAVPVLAHVLRFSPNSGSSRAAAEALQALASGSSNEIKQAIIDAGALTEIVHVLGPWSDPAVKAFIALASGSSDAVKQSIIAAGALTEIVRILGLIKGSSHSNVAGALDALARGSSDAVKQDIIEAGALPELVRILGSVKGSIQYNVAGALEALARGSSDAVKQAIVKAGAVPVLSRALQSVESSSVAELAAQAAAKALEALASGSSNAVKQAIIEAGALSELVRIVGSADTELQSNVAKALVALASGSSDALKYAIIDAGAVFELARILGSYEKGYELLWSAAPVEALEVLARGSSDGVKQAIIEAGALPELVRFLGFRSFWSDPAAGALEALASGSSNAVKQAIIDAGALTKLVPILGRVVAAEALEALASGSSDTVKYAIVDAGAIPRLEFIGKWERSRNKAAVRALRALRAR